MKFKHNKKRNTAFVFESLVREVAKNVIAENIEKKNIVVSTIRKFFNKKTEQYKELQIYRSILEARDLPLEMKEKVIQEARLQHSKLNKEEIFKNQTTLIKEINTMIAKDIFNTFIPNYKNLATIYNLLNMDMSPRKKVILEKQLLEELVKGEEEKQTPSDKLTFSVFMKKYNDKYGASLLSEQKKLLNTYITSFADNGLEMKVFLNEEVGKMKNNLQDLSQCSLAGEFPRIKEKILKVTELLESFKEQPIDKFALTKLLNIQSLVAEMKENVG